ncbi:MAG: DUF3105 domain-containing protein [Candidatus Pacearchaeota archaeon]
MEEKKRCDICDREFKNSDSLAHHNKAKHLEKVPKERKKLSVKKLKSWGIFIVLVILLFFGIYGLVKNSVVGGEDFSKSIPILRDDSHIQVGSEPSVAYNSNPPTSGQHYATPARPGFRENPIEDGYLIHSMEHGLIWISYHPRIGEEADKLREVVGAFTVITERAENDEDIAIAAWGRLDTFNLENGIISAEDLQRINDFVTRYTNKGPERISPGQHGGI